MFMRWKRELVELLLTCSSARDALAAVALVLVAQEFEVGLGDARLDDQFAPNAGQPPVAHVLKGASAMNRDPSAQSQLPAFGGRRQTTGAASDAAPLQRSA